LAQVSEERKAVLSLLLSVCTRSMSPLFGPRSLPSQASRVDRDGGSPVRTRSTTPDGMTEGRVRVFARVRPSKSVYSNVIAHKHAGAVIVNLGDGGASPTRPREFRLDGCFDAEATQRQVFEEVGLPAVKAALEGYSACVLAYGQTGSGKTYSLLQDSGDIGLLPRVCATLFKAVAEDKDATYCIHVSAVQVYNEQVEDLLHPHPGAGQALTVAGAGRVMGALWVACADGEALLGVIQRARERLVYAETKMNMHSSRSHAVFQIKATRRMLGEGTTPATFGTLTVVDLAGSERVKKSGASGAQFREATHVNGSLLALGNVVSAMADRKNHVPYRDSKLTRILEPSLGGNCCTTMLVCVSPEEESVVESLGALEFASRALRVKCHAKVNVGALDLDDLAHCVPLGPLEPFKTNSAESASVEKSLQNKISSFEKAGAAQARALRGAEDRLAESEHQRDAAVATAAALKNQLSEAEKLAADSAVAKATLTAEMEDLRKRAEEAQTALATERGQREELQQELQASADALNQSRATLTAAQLANQATAASLATTQAALARAQQAEGEAQQALSSMTDRATSEAAKSARLAEENERLTSRIGAVEEQLAKSQQEFAATRAELSTTEDQLQQMTRQLHEVQETLRQHRADSTQQAKEAQANLRQEASAAEDKRRAAEAARVEVQGRLAQAEAELARVKKTEAELRAELALVPALRTAAASAKATLEGLSAEASARRAAEKQAYELQQQLSSAMARMSELQAAFTEEVAAAKGREQRIASVAARRVTEEQHSSLRREFRALENLTSSGRVADGEALQRIIKSAQYMKAAAGGCRPGSPSSDDSAEGAVRRRFNLNPERSSPPMVPSMGLGKSLSSTSLLMR